MILQQIFKGYTIKDLAWEYKSILLGCLPEQVKVGSGTVLDVEDLLEMIDRKQKELDLLNNTPLEELVEKEIADYGNWVNILETRFTDEEKMIRLKCNKTIAELEEWQPQAECSKYLKEKLIGHIKDNLSYNLYHGFVQPRILTSEIVEKEILDKKKKILAEIENHKKDYPLVVEYQNARKGLEDQLLKDLELLK